jgi:aspartyl protease
VDMPVLAMGTNFERNANTSDAQCPRVARDSVVLQTAYRCALALVLAVALGIHIFPQSSKPVEIPFRFSHAFDLILVSANVDGHPAVMVLDTGCTHTTISALIVNASVPDLRRSVDTARGSGYSAKGFYTTAWLKVGPVNWRDHPVIIMETQELSKTLGQEIDGMLGMDFLSEFETVTVDLKQRKLILR